MPRIEIAGELREIEDCPHCKRTVLVKSLPATGFIAECGRRLINLKECQNYFCPSEEERHGRAQSKPR
jgi:hypothetical protein